MNTTREQLVSLVVDAMRAEAGEVPENMRAVFDQTVGVTAATAVDALINAGVFTNGDAPAEPPTSTELAALLDSNRERRAALIAQRGCDIDGRATRVDAILETMLDRLLPAADPARLTFEMDVAQRIADNIGQLEQATARHQLLAP